MEGGALIVEAGGSNPLNRWGPRRIIAAGIAVAAIAIIAYALSRAALFYWAAGFR
jgi:hypothetical protein